MIEHLMQAIMSLSDRVVVLDTGPSWPRAASRRSRTTAVIEAYLGDPGLAEPRHAGRP